MNTGESIVPNESWTIYFKNSNAITLIILVICLTFYPFLGWCNFIQIVFFWYQVNIHISSLSDQVLKGIVDKFLKQ